MGRTIIKLGGHPGADAKESPATSGVEESVSAESALSSVTGEGARIVDSMLLRQYLERKYLKSKAEGEDVLGVLAAEAANNSPDLNTNSILYEDWGS